MPQGYIEEKHRGDHAQEIKKRTRNTSEEVRNAAKCRDLLTGQLTHVDIPFVLGICLIRRLSIAISCGPVTISHSWAWLLLCFEDLRFLAPARDLPAIAADVAARMVGGHDAESKGHHCGFEDHECGLIVCELGAEAVSQFRHTVGGADEDEECGESECCLLLVDEAKEERETKDAPQTKVLYPFGEVGGPCPAAQFVDRIRALSFLTLRKNSAAREMKRVKLMIWNDRPPTMMWTPLFLPSLVEA